MKNLYMFLGPEEKDVDDKINELYEKINDKDGIEKKHLFGFDSEDLDVAISDILSPSLFGTSYFLVLDAADAIGEKDAEKLSNAIKDVSGDSYLIIRSKENKISQKLEKCVKQDNKKVFYLMQEQKRKDFVRELFTASGYVISASAIESFISLVDEDKKSLIKASQRVLDYIITYKKENRIDDEDIYKCLEKDKEEDGYNVFYHIAQRNPNALVASIENILNTSPRGFSLIIPSLIACLRKAVAYMQNTGDSEWVLECMSLGKLVVRNPSEKNNIKIFSKNYSLQNAKKLLEFMLSADVNVRKVQPASFQKIYFQTKLARLVAR